MDLALGGFDPYGLVQLPDGGSGLASTDFRNGEEMFASADGCYRVVYIEAKSELKDYRAWALWFASIKSKADEILQKHPEWKNVTLCYTGRPAFETEISASMQKDIQVSIVGTTLIIAFLFWVAHRRWLPMLWLLVLLGLILLTTLALGSLLLGSINIISMGFAAILLGLAVDYALVHYQEALSHPKLSISQIRRAIAPSILWAALTTISAFLVLNLGGLPGLAQLGSLVAIGVALSAAVMVAAYLPPLFRNRNALGDEPTKAGPPANEKNDSARNFGRLAFDVTTVLFLAGMFTLIFHPPQLDRSADALRPTHSKASDALKEMQAALNWGDDPLWVIVKGENEKEVLDLLQKTSASLETARSQHGIENYFLPSMFWPKEENWKKNKTAAQFIGNQGKILRDAAIEEGFAPDAMKLTEHMLDAFKHLGDAPGISWPTNSVSRWLTSRFMAKDSHYWLVMGLIRPGTNQLNLQATRVLPGIDDGRVLISGWPLLGNRMVERVREHMWPVILLVGVLVLGSLALAFRSIGEIALGVSVMLLSGLCLFIVMAAAGWAWNLFSLMALPLILGTGIDYCIFMQLALRRLGGDQMKARRSVGRALMLCGATAVAGFGSLAWSGNAGLSSFGKVCAVGISANMLISVFLLPAWWSAMGLKTKGIMLTAKKEAQTSSENSDSR